MTCSVCICINAAFIVQSTSSVFFFVHLLLHMYQSLCMIKEYINKNNSSSDRYFVFQNGSNISTYKLIYQKKIFSNDI